MTCNFDLKINCKDVVLEETDVAKALVEYVTQAAIEVLIVGASAKTGFLRYVPLMLHQPLSTKLNFPNYECQDHYNVYILFEFSKENNEFGYNEIDVPRPTEWR